MVIEIIFLNSYDGREFRNEHIFRQLKGLGLDCFGRSLNIQSILSVSYTGKVPQILGEEK